MTSKPNSTSPTVPPPVVHLPTTLLALRERARLLLRERYEELHTLEFRLQAQLAELIAHLEHHKPQGQDTEASESRIATLEAEVRHLQRLRSDSEQALEEARVMLAQMEDEYRALRERLDGGEGHQPAQPSREDEEQVELLQRRLEMALQEIRELKEQNAELSSRPTHTASARKAVESDPLSFDWESQKKRLLAQLETDFDSRQPEQAKEKLRLEEVIRETDRIIAEKDREIEEMRRLLTQQTTDSETRSQDSVSQALDVDEGIQAERVRLNQLQEEWQAKLRKAEVEISIERAKLARERLQLEEKLRTLQSQNAAQAEDTAKSDDSKTGAVQRGKWLNRLGLGGGE